jgi:hypothetical protein
MKAVWTGFSKKHAINRIASTRKQWKSNEQSLVPMSLLGAAQEVEVEVVPVIYHLVGAAQVLPQVQQQV